MSNTPPDQRGAEPGRLFAGSIGDDETRDIFAELDDLAQAAAEALGVDSVMVSVRQGELLHTLGSFPALGDDIAARQHVPVDTMCERTIRNAGTLIVEDAGADPDLRQIPYVSAGGIAGYLGVPIDTATEGYIGSLCAITTKPRKWTDLELKYMEQLSRTVAYTLLAGMRQVEQRHLSEELNELDRIIATLAAELSVPTSIYTEEGELAFANASLTALVPLEFVSGFTCSEEATTEKSKDGTKPISSEAIDVPGSAGGAIRFRVSCSKSVSGMMVCHWFPNLNQVS